MSKDYSDHYAWHGWEVGTDVSPEEPGKEWLVITDDGEEYAIIVLRTDASIFVNDSEALVQARAIREQNADRIVAALNAYKEE